MRFYLQRGSVAPHPFCIIAPTRILVLHAFYGVKDIASLGGVDEQDDDALSECRNKGLFLSKISLLVHCNN